MGEHIYHERIALKYKMLKFLLSLRCAAHRGDHLVIEYLGKIETEIKNTSGCLSGAQMSSNHEKNSVRKSRYTLPEDD